MNVPSQSFRPPKPSVIETDCLYSLLRELMSNMWSVSNIRIVTMVHKDHSLKRFRGRISICGQLELFTLITCDCELDEVQMWEGMTTLRMRGIMLILFSLENDFHFSLLWQGDIVLILVDLAFHVWWYIILYWHLKLSTFFLVFYKQNFINKNCIYKK